MECGKIENGSFIKRLQTVVFGCGQNAKTEKLITQRSVSVLLGSVLDMLLALF